MFSFLFRIQQNTSFHQYQWYHHYNHRPLYRPGRGLGLFFGGGGRFRNNIFYGIGLLASRPTSNQEDLVSLFVWVITHDLSGAYQ
jgi:hypothetical protein